MAVADVILAFVWLGLAVAATSFAAGSPVRIFAALTTLLILPGYALTTAVFPATTSGRNSTSSIHTGGVRSVATFSGGDSGPAAISDVERAGLSFGLSLASLPLIGFLAELGFASYDLEPLLIVLTGFLLVVFAIGIYRRLGVSDDKRYELPLGRWIGAGSSAMARAEGWDFALNVALAVAVVLSMSMVGVALVAPQDGNEYTEVALLAQQPDGEWAAKNYPTQLQSEERTPVMFTVSNKEGEPVDYTVVVALQRLDDDGTVTEYRELQRFRNRLSDGETWRNPHEITPTMFGDQLRLTYLVYRGEPPATPSTQNAYRNVSFRVSVGGS